VTPSDVWPVQRMLYVYGVIRGPVHPCHLIRKGFRETRSGGVVEADDPQTLVEFDILVAMRNSRDTTACLQ
jgi:hypothetical protein